MDPAPLDPYAVLGVTAGASSAEIRLAWKTKARQLHPDRNPRPGAREAFVRAWRAFRLLADARARAAFDAQHGPLDAYRDRWAKAAAELDQFARLAGGCHMGVAVERSARSVRGGDALGLLLLSSSRRARGGRVGLGYVRKRRCWVCVDGRRSRWGDGGGKSSACALCRGSGRARVWTVVWVDLPPGLRPGVVLRIAGRGHDCSHPVGLPGDLVVLVASVYRAGGAAPSVGDPGASRPPVRRSLGPSPSPVAARGTGAGLPVQASRFASARAVALRQRSHRSARSLGAVRSRLHDGGPA